MRGTPSITNGPSKPATLAPVSPGYAKVFSGRDHLKPLSLWETLREGTRR